MMPCFPLLLILLFFSILPTESKLSTEYYAKSCPQFGQIIRETVTSKQIASPTTAAATLRLFFHDCMIEGCDGSILIASNYINKAERDADINLSLPGDAFDVVVRAKTSLELTCPGIVSCADILAATTRDLVTMVGGPFFKVRLGRKDGLVSKASNVDGNLPLPSMSTDQLIQLFATKGFTIQEMVALNGAHTIGFSHCKEFANRIFPTPDTHMNPTFAERLRSACANYQQNSNMAVFNDVMTPGKFDNMYYKNIQNGLAVLSSDQALLLDPRTKPFAMAYAANQTLFFDAFAHAMEKLSHHGVKTGRKGEVRHKCDTFNNLNNASS